MVDSFHRVLDHLEKVESGVVIIQGAGGKIFASGADIGELLERGRREALQGINAKLFSRLEECPLVTIAAVEGYALGGGCEMVIACDLRVAGSAAVFGLPEVGLGIIPGAGGVWRLTRLIGLARAKELVLTARRVTAQKALEMGLVHRVTEAGKALDEALGWAGKILELDPLALRFGKEILNASPDAARETLDALSMNAQAVLFESPGKKERMSRFLKKGSSPRRADPR
jgi:enoyl-CoA hydratase